MGAVITCMNTELFQTIPNECKERLPTPKRLHVHAASGHQFRVQGMFGVKIMMTQQLTQQTNQSQMLKVLVVDGLTAGAILGMDFLVAQRVIIDTETRKVILQGKPGP